MAKNQVMFFATALDLGSVLSPLEAEKPLQYTLTGLFETNKPQTYLSYAHIPEFGRARYPTAAVNPSYLVSLQGAEVRVREVSQKAGGVFFAIDQLGNEYTVVFRPGGRHGNNVILCGMIGTVSQSAASKALYNFFVKPFRKNFLKKQEFLVGREALDVWNAGARLTIGASSPPEFDLKRETGSG
jgi:hypothetical protein